jgi:hypothetical protein
MSRTVTVAIGSASAIALAVVLGVFFPRDKTAATAVPEGAESVAEPPSAEPNAAETKSHPRLLTTRGAAPTPRSPAGSDAGKLLDEASLLTKLHDLGISDPPLSLKLAKEAVDRFPDSPSAPEFEWNVVKALFNMGRLEDAKDEARIMLWKYPNSDFTVDVDRHLLHTQPNPKP